MRVQLQFRHGATHGERLSSQPVFQRVNVLRIPVSVRPPAARPRPGTLLVAFIFEEVTRNIEKVAHVLVVGSLSVRITKVESQFVDNLDT